MTSLPGTEYNKGFAILDKDQNGSLTRSEFGIASKLFFDILDKEGNGKLSRKEYEAGFALMETDRNGKIDKREFNKKFNVLFRHASVSAVLDADGDGRATHNEYEAGIDLIGSPKTSPPHNLIIKSLSGPLEAFSRKTPRHLKLLVPQPQ